MIIRKYGIELVRLNKEDLELVRVKRNNEEIRSRMFYQKEITKEEQLAWFDSINNENYYYFIIKSAQKKIGLIHGKIKSYQNRIAEGGVFIWDRNSLGSHIPIIASVCMADLTFLVMKMKKTLAEVRKDNPGAISYNLRIGYQIIEELEQEGKVIMELTKESYLEKAEKIRRMVKKIAKDPTDLSWNDIEIEREHYDRLYLKLPLYLKKEVDKKIKNV